MQLYLHATFCEFQRNVIKYTLIIDIKEKPVFCFFFFFQFVFLIGHQLIFICLCYALTYKLHFPERDDCVPLPNARVKEREVTQRGKNRSRTVLPERYQP